jgi:hypothetical protein
VVYDATSFGSLHTTAERRARWGGDVVEEGGRSTTIRLEPACLLWLSKLESHRVTPKNLLEIFARVRCSGARVRYRVDCAGARRSVLSSRRRKRFPALPGELYDVSRRQWRRGSRY